MERVVDEEDLMSYLTQIKFFVENKEFEHELQELLLNLGKDFQKHKCG